MAICKLVLIVLCLFILAQKDPEIDENRTKVKRQLSNSRNFEEDALNE